MADLPPLKLISASAIPAALAKAERYRLLNEPHEAESICRDILAVEDTHQQALTVLLLALTDQFPEANAQLKPAQETLARLNGEYEREYYAGIVSERWAKVELARHVHSAYDWIRDAMSHYEKAEQLAQENHDPVLRWNACVRFIAQHQLAAPPESGDIDAGDSAPY